MLRTATSAIAAALLAACAAGGGRGPSAEQAGALVPGLRADQADFVLADRREVKVIYSILNISRSAVRLDFPTSQHLEVVLRSPEGRQIFFWSEDRDFAAESTAVVVNPGERLEYQAAVPTRDMLAGRIYTAEAMIPGYASTLARATLQPR